MTEPEAQPEAQPEYYLILHKVRGAPAFDIAHKCPIGNEEGWIVSTSGHRAWPQSHWPLAQFFSQTELDEHLFTPLPPALQDHYAVGKPRDATTTLEDLGL